MKALVLAAGLGTRLRPYTRTLPKPLFPIGGEPLLARHLRSLARAGVTHAAVNVHHLHTQIEDLIDASDWGLEVTISHEPEILGTGGAMKALADLWGNAPFVVVNADVVCDLDLAKLYRAHLAAKASATLVMHDHSEFNSVAVRADGEIARMPPEALRAAVPGSRLMAFTGIHVVDPSVLAVIPAGRYYSIIDAYRRLLDDGERLWAYRPPAGSLYWRDIGTPAQYRLTAYEQLAPIAFRAAFGGPAPAHEEIQRTPLAGDGSDRRWYRLHWGERRLILADHDLRDLPPPAEADAYVAIGHHLHGRGVAVPRIHAADPFSGLVCCEDLGDENLQEHVAALAAAERYPEVEEIYRQVIDRLVHLGMAGAEGFDPDWTYQTAAYDEALILDKECRYFTEAFISRYLGLTAKADGLADEFTALAEATVANGIPGLVHRDMQARNIMVRDGRCYFIDFQGARPGPLQYDLAALLIDPYVDLDTALQERLFEHYCARLAERCAYDLSQFRRGYRLCRITRNLQILGAFAYLSREKKKAGFAGHIPAALAALASNLDHPEVIACPQLKALTARATARLKQEKERKHGTR